MKVRATEDFGHLGIYYSEGDFLSLDWDQGLNLLQAGSIEPAIDLEPFRPPLDMNGLTLWETFLLHVRDFPLLKPLLEEGDVELRPYRPRVRQYARLPKWPGLPAARSGRSARTERNWVHDWETLGNSVHVRARKSRATSGPTIGKLYQNTMRNYLRCAATYFFLERLADEELHAVGVDESDLKTLKTTKIPAGWWRRDILLDLGRNEMWELMGPNPEPLVRRYSEVRIEKPTASQKRGRRGRPSRGEELVKAFHELRDSGCLTKDGLKNKKGVWAEVLEHLDYSPQTPGCSYNSFVQHVGPYIDQSLQTRDSEN